ncbi:hypothetical protein SHIRM173S_11647 [Streptomyces hirsutus]
MTAPAYTSSGSGCRCRTQRTYSRTSRPTPRTSPSPAGTDGNDVNFSAVNRAKAKPPSNPFRQPACTSRYPNGPFPVRCPTHRT